MTHAVLSIIINCISFVVFVGCCHRNSGYVSYYQLHFNARIWFSRLRCSGHETNITRCSFSCYSSCSNPYPTSCNAARVSCQTGMHYHMLLSLLFRQCCSRCGFQAS